MSEQSDTMIDSATDPTLERDSSSPRSEQLQHVAVECDDEIAVCTLFPQEMNQDELSSKWITATGDAFVSLPECR